MTPAPADRERTGASQETSRAVNRHGWRDAVWSSGLSATLKLVALAYAEHARESTEQVWVTRERLQALTSLSTSGVKKALRHLEDTGWLVVTVPARQHLSTRYALRVPEESIEEDSTPQGVTTKPPERVTTKPSEPSRGSPGNARGSPGNARGSRGDPDPLNHPLTQPTNQGAPTTHSDQTEADEQPLTGLAAEIRNHKLSAGVSARVIDHHAHSLQSSGWDAPALANKLSAENFSSARGSGLLLHRLTNFAESGPPRTPTASKADDSRCQDHGTRGASSCSSCWSEVKTGDRQKADVGLVPRPYGIEIPA